MEGPGAPGHLADWIDRIFVAVRDVPDPDWATVDSVLDQVIDTAALTELLTYLARVALHYCHRDNDGRIPIAGVWPPQAQRSHGEWTGVVHEILAAADQGVPVDWRVTNTLLGWDGEPELLAVTATLTRTADVGVPDGVLPAQYLAFAHAVRNQPRRAGTEEIPALLVEIALGNWRHDPDWMSKAAGVLAGSTRWREEGLAVAARALAELQPHGSRTHVVIHTEIPELGWQPGVLVPAEYPADHEKLSGRAVVTAGRVLDAALSGDRHALHAEIRRCQDQADASAVIFVLVLWLEARLQETRQKPVRAPE